MTLSRFLRDYIYIPLGGNKNGNFRTYVNLMATFVIGGFWHGAGWTFLFWGFLHGLALCIHRVWTKLGFKMWTWLAWLITFNFVNVAWIFFRAKEWDDAIKVLKGMVGLSGFIIENITLTNLIKLDPETLKLISIVGNVSKIDMILYILIVFLSIFILFIKNSIELTNKFRMNNYYILFIVFCFLTSLLFINSIKETEFLYFDF